jgi:hypothetical protein
LLDEFVPEERTPKGRTVIDLGVGDFVKGTSIMRKLLARDAPGCIKYIALDASYEMLTTSLGRAKVLNELLERDGHVIGINALFDDLDGFQHLFAEPGRNVFLLLGNTLGNELDEKAVLDAIGRSMKDGDILITELQLQEAQPIPLPAMAATANESREFFTGPFVAVGYPREDISITVRCDELNHPERANGIWGYDYLCKLHRDRDVRLLGRSDPVRLRAGEVLVYLVRKYGLNSLDSHFDHAGLRIVRRIESPPIGKYGRRFGYFVAVKQQDR